MALTSNEMANFDELAVDKRVEGSLLVKRILLIIAHIVVYPVFLVLMAVLFGGGGIALSLIIGIPLYFCWALPKFVFPLTWRYVNISYTYTIKSGKFSMIKTYAAKGSKTSKEVFKSVSIGDMIAIAPYNGEHKAAADASDIDIRYETCAFLAHPDNYYCIWKDENGKKCVSIFQATNNTVKIMAFHNRATVVTEVQKVSALGK